MGKIIEIPEVVTNILDTLLEEYLVKYLDYIKGITTEETFGDVRDRYARYLIEVIKK